MIWNATSMPGDAPSIQLSDHTKTRPGEDAEGDGLILADTFTAAMQGPEVKATIQHCGGHDVERVDSMNVGNVLVIRTPLQRTYSIDNRLIDELPEERPVVGAQRATRLNHEDRDQLLLWIDLE